MNDDLGGIPLPAAPRAGAAARRPLLGDLLIREGLISEADLKQALDIQVTLPDYAPLGQVLVHRGVLTRDVLTAVLQRYHKKDRLGYEEGPPQSSHFLAALELAERERSQQGETDRAIVAEMQKALAELGETNERLGGLEHRYAEMGRLLVSLQADCEGLGRQNRDALARVQALETRQAQVTEAVTQLQVRLEALRRDHDASRDLLQELRGRCQGMLDESHAMVVSIESAVRRLKNGGSA